MVYLPISKISDEYGLSKRTIYRFLDEIRQSPRYKKAWIALNECGTALYNTLVLEDYLRYRAELKEKNINKSIPPYNPKEVMWQRGDDSDA